jgi:hypothetical protein
LPHPVCLPCLISATVQERPFPCPMTKYIALASGHSWYGTAHCLDAANLWHRPNGTG